ncbi:uncharacterized protein N7484_008532 [Penicillium longicatenatum]|uniref:uncharacterized protein n=1 Tax=Penicillium longicatenatum TaxID=1561947 RepID=UPI0025486021|nr:uncharacterized protein N7484_008532 [Penicillium longicatenatum]KAJ5635219.1 hypothetical protein N7484_008532 [Penicillium longicatenatum]
MAPEYGNSLMSERGYDSDAHYITTPRRDLGRSPASRGLRQMELSDLIEQSQERSEAERWAMTNAPTATDSQESVFGMHFIPTPPGTLRGPPTTFHTARDTDEFKYQPTTPSPLRAERTHKSPVLTKIFGGSLPSLSSTNDPGASHSEHSPVLIVPETSSGRDLMSDWKQFMKTSRDQHGAGSFGSLPTSSADLLVSKTRQPSNSARSFTDPRDPRAIHLSELGISNRLVSFSQSSRVGSCSPSSTELFYKKRGAMGNFSQENVQFSQSGASVISGNETPKNPNDRRDASSCYSQASPSSGSLSIGGLSFKKLTSKIIDPKPKPKPALQDILTSDNEAVNVPAPRNTILSRFQEHCDSGNSDSPQFQNHPAGIVSPRKVSVGWMSGGRRVGYGYNPVPGKEGGSPKKDNQSPPQMSQIPGSKAEFTTNVVHGSPPNHHQLEKMAQLLPRQYGNPSPSHPRLPLYEALTGPRSVKSKSNTEYAAPPNLWAILGRSSQEQNTIAGSNEGSSNVLCAPELTPIVQPELCQLPQSAHNTSLRQGRDSFINQWARLSRSKNKKSQSQDQKTELGGVTNSERLQEIVFYDHSDETEPEFHDTEHHDESVDQAHELQTNTSRVVRWANRFSRYRESRRPPTVRQQERSQSSSGAYQDCDSASISLKRATSTRSNTADDPDHFEMPGSFEGSRWASRISRLL